MAKRVDTEQTWHCDVDVKWSHLGAAVTKKQFVESVKKTFYEDFALHITDAEIKNIETVGGKA